MTELMRRLFCFGEVEPRNRILQRRRRRSSPQPNTPEKEAIIDESENEVIFFNKEGSTSEPFKNPGAPKNQWLVNEIEFRVNNLNDSSMQNFFPFPLQDGPGGP